MTDAFLSAFDALPLGSFNGTYDGRSYVVTRQDFSGGHSQKLIAEELGGNDYISLNPVSYTHLTLPTILRV